MALNHLPQAERLLSGTIINSGIDATQTNVQVSNPPTRIPTYLDLDWADVLKIETVRVVAVSGSTLTIERGINSGGVGRDHGVNAAYKQKIFAVQWQALLDALESGYLKEDSYNTLTRVSGVQFYIGNGDYTPFYTQGRILRFNGSDGQIGIVDGSTYDGVNNRTVVDLSVGTLPSPLTLVELAIQPRGATNRYPTSSEIQNGGIIYAVDSGSTDTYVITLSPVPSAYTAGMKIYFKANTINTGPATLNVNGLGAKNIKKNVTEDLADGDVKAGEIVQVVYDGTNFQLLNEITANKGFKVLTDGSTITIDLASKERKFKIPAMAGNRILAFANALLDGDTIAVEIEQDATGSRTITRHPNKATTFQTTDVNTATDIITVGRDIRTGHPIQFSSLGTLPAGLSAATTYYAIRDSSTTIKVATTISNAQAGTAVNITDTGSGVHTVTTETAWGGGNTPPALATGAYRHDMLGYTIIDAANGIYMGSVINPDY